MTKLEVDATLDNLSMVTDFIDNNLENIGCTMKIQMQIDVAVEELYVNIAHYAYPNAIGKATIQFDFDDKDGLVSISFVDNGIEYNPLLAKDPDTTLSAEDREIGGLGIFMVKKSMDDIKYEYKDSQNITTIYKHI